MGGECAGQQEEQGQNFVFITIIIFFIIFCFFRKEKEARLQQLFY